MGRASRQKGKVGEREAVHQAREHWHAAAPRRSQQVDGGLTSDIVGALPEAHVEVKRYKGIAACRFFDQADEDRAPHEYPVVMMREDRGDWLVMFRVADSARFAQSLASNLHHKIQTTDDHDENPDS